MSAKILDGRALSQKILSQLRAEIEELGKRHTQTPTLANVQVGEIPASIIYTRSQERQAQQLGVGYRALRFPAAITQRKLEAVVRSLNRDRAIHGIIVQLPLPKQIDARKISTLIDPRKDVEGITPENIGQAMFGRIRVGSTTALAIMELVHASGVRLYGKEAVVVGHSEIVGKPVGLLLLDQFATTTVCHIATAERGLLEEHIRRAEILVVAVGRPHLVKGDWIRKGAVVIDVGINYLEHRVVGDVEFEDACKRASFITPVPGGVGPLTATMLMRNLVQAYRLQKESQRR